MNIGKFIDDKFREYHIEHLMKKAIIEEYNENGTAELGDDGEIAYQLWYNWLLLNEANVRLKVAEDKLNKLKGAFWSIL
jgi:hypothetical protein